MIILCHDSAITANFCLRLAESFDLNIDVYMLDGIPDFIDQFPEDIQLKQIAEVWRHAACFKMKKP